MKKIYLVVPLLAIALASAFLLSCRKETLRIVDDPANQPAAYCSDGIMDGDEQDVDCGGSCSTCAASALTPPCTPNNNSISLTGGGPSSNFSYVTADSTSGFQLTSTSTSGATDITVRLSTNPSADRVYYITSNTFSTLDYANASIQIQDFISGTFIATSGKIYVTRVNGKVRITFCGVQFSNQQITSYSGTGTGRLTAN